jgi:hypothetical protein
MVQLVDGEKPMRRGYQDCKGPSLHGDEVYVYGAVGQAQYVCVCGTKSSADEQSSINIQSTSHNCWLRCILGVAQQVGTKHNGRISQNNQNGSTVNIVLAMPKRH